MRIAAPGIGPRVTGLGRMPTKVMKKPAKAAGASSSSGLARRCLANKAKQEAEASAKREAQEKKDEELAWFWRVVTARWDESTQHMSTREKADAQKDFPAWCERRAEGILGKRAAQEENIWRVFS